MLRRRIRWHVEALGRWRCRLIDAWKGGLAALAGRQNVPSVSFVFGEIFDRQTTEEVVHEARRDSKLGIIGHTSRLEPHTHERIDKAMQRHPVLQAVADRDGKGVHDSRQRRSLLGHPNEQLTGASVLVFTDRRETLAVSYPELERARPARAREPFTNGM